jgi:phosphoribosylanthranilate isomerase
LTWIKICGTTNSEDAAIAVEAGADAIGVIFAPSARRITPAMARGIVIALPQAIEKVGVFVNEAPQRVRDIAGEVGLTAVQLHGDEDAGYLRQLQASLENKSVKLRVFKAVAVRPGMEKLLEDLFHQNLIDGLLLDSAPPSAVASRGGTGKTFDWEHAAGVLASLSVRERVHVVIGGGLSPGNVERAIAKLQPWGVDVCSGVEREPGRKDPEKVKTFVAAVRAAASHG